MLGAAMRDERAASEVVGMLKPEDFAGATNRRVFAAVVHVLQSHERVDLATVANRLEQAGHLVSVGGRAALVGIADSVFTGANAMSHARILREKRILRETVAYCDALKGRCAGQSGDVHDLIRYASDGIAHISGLIPSSEVGVDNQIEKMMDSDWNTIRGGRNGWEWPVEGMTEATRGILPGKFYIILGFFKSGKSKLLTTTLAGLARPAPPTLFFSMEMSAPMIFRWMACSHLLVDTSIFDSRKPDQDSVTRVHQWVMEHVGTGWLKVNEVSLQTPGMICAAIRRDHAERGTKLVLIDYLQKINWGGGRDTRNEIKAGMGLIWATCRDLGITLVGLSQVPKSAGDKMGRTKSNLVTINDAKDSGVFAEMCDCAISITDETRDRESNPKTFKFLIQQRDGATRLLTVMGDMRYGNFHSIGTGQ